LEIDEQLNLSPTDEQLQPDLSLIGEQLQPDLSSTGDLSPTDKQL